MVLKSKIVTIIALTIMLTIGATTVVLLRVQHIKMLNSTLRETELLSEVIENTIDKSMKEGNTSEVQTLIENIGKSREILALRIISPEGTILKSKSNVEIGAKATDFIKSSSSDKFHKPTIINDTTINYFHKINNRGECYGCHDKKTDVVGVIQIKQDATINFEALQSIKRMLILSNIAVVLAVSVILSFLFSNLVMNPLKKLLNTIREVESGNWEAKVSIDSNDELGIIGSSFNTMIEEITRLYKKNVSKEKELSKIKLELEHKNRVHELNSQLEFKIKELETANKAITSLSKEVKSKNIELEKAVDKLKKINEIGRVLTSIIETKELVRIIIHTTAEILNAEKVTMHLKNSDRPAMTIRYQRGLGMEDLTDFSLELDKDYAEIHNSGKTIFFSGLKSGNGDKRTKGPHIGVPLRLKGQVIGAMILENDASGSCFTEDELELLVTITNQAMVAIDNAWMYESVKTNYFSTIQSLVNALEASDRFTKGHSERVKVLSLELGRYVGLDFRELELLEHASILHDIGKIGIDNIILQKQGKLTSKEYSLIKTHPLIGDEILGPINNLDGVRKTIIQHHERYDGTGYPYGLRGDEISLKSKILSVVDTFDAMMSDRPYRSAISLEKVKEELRVSAGSQFDPHVVEAFIDMLSRNGEELLSSAGYGTFFSST